MEIVVHDTASLYHKMIEAESLSRRTAVYRNELLAPFADALATLANAMPGELDVLQMVSMWGFLMPDDLSEIPPALVTLEEHDAWTKSQLVLEHCAGEFAPFRDRIDLDTIHYGLFLGKEEQANPLNRGYTGMGGIPGTIFALYAQPNTYNLSKLAGLVAHEFHHNVQLTLFPWDQMNVSLAQWMIYEGMAESFARALYGDAVLGYYVTDFDMTRFEETRQMIADHLDVKGFNAVRSYIYGDMLADTFGFETVGVPPFAGYAIGYHIVQAYLEKTGDSVISATFAPADTIIERSGFFTCG